MLARFSDGAARDGWWPGPEKVVIGDISVSAIRKPSVWPITFALWSQNGTCVLRRVELTRGVVLIG